MLESQQVN